MSLLSDLVDAGRAAGRSLDVFAHELLLALEGRIDALEIAAKADLVADAEAIPAPAAPAAKA